VYGKATLHLHVISHIKASLHHLVERKIEEIHVVREFLDVFSYDLPGMPPERATEFNIELQPDSSYSQGSVSDDTSGIGRVEGPTQGVARQRLYSPKFITLVLFSIVCIKKG
jgi:hypothetical protein